MLQKGPIFSEILAKLEGRKHLNSFTCIFITEFRVVQAMIKRRSTTNRVRAK